MFKDLSNLINEIEEEYGGDITLIPPASRELVDSFEKDLGYQLPKIFRYFYESESNGFQIDNKLIYSILDKGQKKTLSENLQRANNPKTSYWFKHKPEIFNDYLVIGSDGQICFAIYKHRDLENPSIYICENSNSKENVVLQKLEMNLNNLIETMVENSF